MSETILTQAPEKILDGVLAEFAKPAAIPRPSKHEEIFFAEQASAVVQNISDGME